MLNIVSIDHDDEAEVLRDRVDQIMDLEVNYSQLSERDQEFAMSLLEQYSRSYTLSLKQWHWVYTLNERVIGIEPLYGDFDAVHVMFRLAGESLKKPKIRLVSHANRFVQLNFDPETRNLKIFVDGWQGHGVRKFAGVIEGNVIKPYDLDRCSEDVKLIIQEFALDPQGVSKAMALKLGCCLYCGSRLSDDESKAKGYGPICAGHYGLPWGNATNKRVELPENLAELFWN